MKIKKNRILLLLQAVLLCVHIPFWAAADRPVPPKYITAAILIDIKPKLFVNLLNQTTVLWDKQHTQTLGSTFVEQRTLLKDEGYHMTLVNFEFDSEKMGDKEKKELMGAAYTALKNLADALLPMAISAYAFLKFDPSQDGRKIIQPDPLSTGGVYSPGWQLNFKKFEIVSGRVRFAGHKPPRYLVVTLNTDDILVKLRENIIKSFKDKFPAATTGAEFIPHVSIVRMSPKIKETEVTLPNQIPGFKSINQFFVPMSSQFVRINVEERGGPKAVIEGKK